MILPVLITLIALNLVQAKHFLVETEDNKGEDNKDKHNKDEDNKDKDNKENLLTEKQISAVIKAFPEPENAELIYNSLNKSTQNAIKKKLHQAYGGDENAIVEAVKDGSILEVGDGGDYIIDGLGDMIGPLIQQVAPMAMDMFGQIMSNVGDGGLCFSGGSTVQTRRGVISINQLVLGDSVLTISRDKGLIYTEFLGWLDRSAKTNGEFLKISTNSSSILLTGNHLIFRTSVADGALMSVFADEIEEGDKLVSLKGSKMTEEAVVAVEPAIENGIWAPLTMEGTLLVDGLLASCYASFPHAISDLALAPVKMFPRMLLDDQESLKVDGCREVVKLTKEVVTAMGLRQRNQGDKENAQRGWLSGNEQPALGVASSSKHMEF